MEKILTIGILICWTGICLGSNTPLTSWEKPQRLNEAPNDERAPYVELILRTRKNKREPEKRIFEDGRAPAFQNFDPKRETVILLPGATIFGQGYSFYYASFFSYAFLRNGDYNVISVQWNLLIDLNLIRQTLQNAVFVGELIAALINSIRKSYEGTAGFFLIGHHYGTISAATAGSLLEQKLERLMALDPQEIPSNVKLPHWAKLERSCAEVVEVIHTSGHTPAMGHRDFYPNGGTDPQPGCVFDFFDYCSTEKAFLYYGADIITNGHSLNATNCETYEEYIDHQCDDRETISLWNKEDSYSYPIGSYFFKILPETELRQAARRRIQTQFRRSQKHPSSRRNLKRFQHRTSF